MGRYQLFVGPASGNVPTQEVTVFDAWQLERNIDDGCTLTFTMPGNSPAGEITEELSFDIWLYLDGSVDQRFRVLELQREWDEDGRHDVAVTAVCYRRIFASRHLNTDLSFSGVSQGEILFDLIDHTQNLPGGDLGITIGDLGPSVPRVRNYEAGQNILELAVNLSQIIGGLTWDVDENLELQVSRFRDYPLRSQPIILGGNARRLVKPSGAALFANAVLVSGDNEATVLEIKELANLSTDPRGRWERFQSFPSVVRQETLEEHADGLLVEANSPTVVWEIEIDPARFFGDSNYELGDFVQLSDPSVGFVVAQILTQSVTQTADGEIGVVYNAVQVREFPLQWRRVPNTIAWEDVDSSITWFDASQIVL